jgi:hypothetical protein
MIWCTVQYIVACSQQLQKLWLAPSQRSELKTTYCFPLSLIDRSIAFLEAFALNNVNGSQDGTESAESTPAHRSSAGVTDSPYFRQVLSCFPNGRTSTWERKMCENMFCLQILCRCCMQPARSVFSVPCLRNSLFSNTFLLSLQDPTGHAALPTWHTGHVALV